MAITITSEETELRQQLSAAVTRVRLSISRLPALEVIDERGLTEVANLIAETNSALADATSLTTLIEQLTCASEEAVVLVPTSRLALSVAREALTLYTAEADSKAA